MFVEDFVECSFGQDCDISFISAVDRRRRRTYGARAGRAGRGLSRPWSCWATRTFNLPTRQFCSTTKPRCWSSRSKIPIAGAPPTSAPTGVVDGACTTRSPISLADLKALIGVYYFPKLSELRQAARTAVDRNERESRRTELAEILQNVMATRPLRAVAGRRLARLRQPRPPGQLAPHAAAKARVQRAVDRQRAGHRHQAEPLRRKVSRRDQLPASARRPIWPCCFPACSSYSTDWQDSWLTLEYYGYPTLAEAFVFENVDPGIWERVFVHLREIIVARIHAPPTAAVARRDRGHVPGQDPQTAGKADRPAGTDGPGAARRPRARQRPRSGQPAGAVGPAGRGSRAPGRQRAGMRRARRPVPVEHSVRFALGRVQAARSCAAASARPASTAIRATTWPSSITRSTACTTSSPTICSTSTIDGDNVELAIRSRPQHQQIQERFEKVFFAEFDRREILLITGLLFASMPALHYDAPRRQMAMYARALELFGEVFSPIVRRRRA